MNKPNKIIDTLHARNRDWQIPVGDVAFNNRFFMFIGDNMARYGQSLGYDFLGEMNRYGMITATRDAPGHMGGDVTYVPLAQGVEWVKEGQVAYFTHWDNDQGRSHDHEGLGVEGYHDYLLETAGKINAELGSRRVWINYGGEADSCFPWPAGQRKFVGREEAFEYYRNRVLSKEARAECFAFWSGWFQHALEKSGGSLRRLPMIWTCAEVHDVHYWFEWGVPFITFETNCWRSLPLNTQIAFTRGAARQYNSLWGIDVSLWNWPGRLSIYSKLNEWISGQTADYYLRQWMLSYMAGANAVHFELAASQFFVEKGPAVKLWPEHFGEAEAAALFNEEFGPQDKWFIGGGMLVPSTIGNHAIDFNEFSAARYVDRGQPVIGLGLLLDYHHGWGTSASFSAPPDGRVMWREMSRPRVWGDCIDRTAGDGAMDGFFRAAFPMVHKDILRDPVTGSMGLRELYEAFWLGRLDPGDYLPGLADTRWGNHLEVLLDNATLPVLRQYPNLMLLGEIVPGEAVWDRIESYVRGGGNLITSVAHLSQAACARLGLKDANLLKAALPHNTVWKSQFGARGTDRLLYAEIKADAGRPLVQSASGDPLLVQLPQEKGSVFVSAVPHYLDLDGNIAPHVLAFLDRQVGQTLPVKVSGSRIDFSVSRRPDCLAVTLLNHHAEPWQGYLMFGSDRASAPRVRDVWRERTIDPSHIEAIENGWKIQVGVRGRSLAVYGIEDRK